eukprot:scaffold105659_cov66-Phaeocystis_antarctica.AAC.2
MVHLDCLRCGPKPVPFQTLSDAPHPEHLRPDATPPQRSRACSSVPILLPCRAEFEEWRARLRRRLQRAVVFEAGCEEARRCAQRARGVGAHGWRCLRMLAATSLHPQARRNWFQYSKSSSAGSSGSSWQQQRGDGSENGTHQWASICWAHCNWLLAGLR